MTSPSVLLPDVSSLYLQRAQRLRRLAQRQSAMAGYLELMALLAEIQQRLCDSFPAVPLPLGTPAGANAVLDIATWPRATVWREVLETIAVGLELQPAPLSTVAARIRQAANGEQERWAKALLAADFSAIDAAVAPFVAAALQCYWSVMAARLGAIAQDSVHATPGRCPVCGFYPIAGRLQTGGGEDGLRYLCCALCMSKWHLARIHCAYCNANHAITYYTVAGSDGAVQAEACGACNSYVKLMNPGKAPELEVFADDLATLALDLLMAEQGFARYALNPLLVATGPTYR